MSSKQLELLSFNGADGEDPTEFIRNVKRIALVEGQQRSDQWIIDYTESCLAGPALEWFLDLEDNVKGSWAMLQRAALKRFQSRIPPKVNPTSSVPPLPSTVKYLILGDSGVGKSCLLKRFLAQGWATDVAPTVDVHYEVRHIICDDRAVEQHIWDTSGSVQFDGFRRHYYAGTDTLWLVYDITNRMSFENIRRWYASTRDLGFNFANIQLIGNKSDLHDKRTISLGEGEDLARYIKAKSFAEASAKTNEGLQRAFGSWGLVLKKYA
ncbi:GTP-binding protein [Tulasnella sp. 331]|nr:GTP-binding protein [Tulasnella sp. 331]KAG8880945.1 GTP-binding protein [Tulasnella sp. 332]